MPFLHRFMARHLPMLAWLGVAFSALVMVAVVTDRIAEARLRQDAEQTAAKWAALVLRMVPDLDLVFDGETPSPGAQTSLTALRSAGDVFGFRFFDAQGRLLMRSESLVRAPVPTAADLQAGDIARGVAQALAPKVMFLEGDGLNTPRVYSQAFVTVRQAGRLLGVLQVEVDQTERADANRGAFQSVALCVAGASLLVMIAGAWVWVLRSRKDAQNEERIRFLAHHDVLTGALNRASFNEALDRAIRHQGKGAPNFAVLCIDLDHFKEVNDTLGHPAGDELLRQVTQRLRDTVRLTDQVARLGGDEFALLQMGVAGSEDVSLLAQRIVTALAAPFDLAGQHVIATASVGVAIHGIDATDAEGLLHRADLALYRAKTQGRNGHSFYDAGLDAHLNERRTLTRDLREAITLGKLVLHFQPLYEADGRTLSGYEALVRWPHPQRGFVPPSEFIPLAEETGLIEDLGRWVLRRACVEAAAWPDGLNVSVNLSSAQFRTDRGLVREVRQALAQSGLPASRLELEITESLLLSNTESVLGTLHALRDLGVRISMDDFGTGYSSLAYLWRFPFDKVKIDRAFVKDLNDNSKVDMILRSIVTLAHSLGMRVNAEGIETASQMAVLQALGCDELQGYLLGRPTAVEGMPHIERPAAPRADAAVAPGAAPALAPVVALFDALVAQSVPPASPSP